MSHYIQEAVPFRKSDVVSQRLQKSTLPTLSPETFGVEFEYSPGTNIDDIDIQDYSEDIVQSMTTGDNWYHNENSYLEWLEDKRQSDNRRYGQYYEWDDSHGLIDPDTWEEHHPYPERDDYGSDTDGGQEEFDDAVSKWKDEQSEVASDYAWWSRSSKKYDYIEEWADEMIRDGTWHHYTNINLEDLASVGSPEKEIGEAEDFIKTQLGDVSWGQYGKKDSWGVGPDGDNIEIRSKHLKENELWKIEKLIVNFVSHKMVSGETSAHVHVGLPSKFDAFDVIAMSDLVDEEEIKKAIRGDRDYDQWARLNYDLAGDLMRGIGNYFQKVSDAIKNGEHAHEMETKAMQQIETGWIITMETLSKILRSNMRKFRGTNLLSFFDHRTIEFRYWSSEAAVKEPKKFLQWIRYFLLLPKVANKRNKVIIGTGRTGSLVCSREGSDKVKIEFEDKFKEAVLKNYEKRMRDRYRDQNQMQFNFRQ